MDIKVYGYDSQEGYYGSKEDYYNEEGYVYNSLKYDNKELKSTKSKFQISNEKREELRLEIKKYFYEERGEELGELACNMLLDFFIEKIAPEFYHQGIEDAYKYIIEKLADLLEIKNKR